MGFAWLRTRSKHRFHGREHINKQRRQALILILTGLARVFAWVTLLALYGLHLVFPHILGFTAVLFASVPFVAVVSLYANAATDWGQVAASLAQLTAGDAHHDAQADRHEISIDLTSVEEDIAQLAKLQPGSESDELVLSIRRRLKS